MNMDPLNYRAGYAAEYALPNQHFSHALFIAKPNRTNQQVALLYQ